MRSFINRDIARQLGLETISEETMVIKSFGSEANKESKIFSYLLIQRIFSRCQNNSVGRTCLRNYFGESIYQRSLLTFELKRKGFTLALAECFHWNQKVRTVGLLIGTDHYWKIVEEGILTSKCGLRAVSSKLGWLISGRPENWTTIRRHCCLD